MKMFFWFAVVVLLIITFSGKEPIKPYRDSLYGHVLQLVPDSWQSETQVLTALQRDLSALGETLGQGQQDLLNNAAKDTASVIQFRQRYCLNNNFNPVLFGEPLRKSCAIIEQYYFRLSGN